MIAVLKALGFLNDASGPTERYLSYKNPAIAKAVLGRAPATLTPTFRPSHGGTFQTDV